MTDDNGTKTHLLEAISIMKSIKDCTALHSPFFAERSWKLGRLRREAGHLTDARRCLEAAARGITPRRSEHTRCLRDLGATLFNMSDNNELYEVHRNVCLPNAAAVYTRALTSLSGDIFVRVRSGNNAGMIFYNLGNFEKAFTTLTDTISLFPYLVNRQFSTKDQQEMRKGLSQISSLAAAAALKLGKSKLQALQVLESGRGVILKQMLNLKEEYTELKFCQTKLHAEYCGLQKALLSLSHDAEGVVSSVSRTFRISSERVQNVQRLNDLIRQIRNLSGLESFPESLSNDDIENLLADKDYIVVFSYPPQWLMAEPELFQAFLIKCIEDSLDVYTLNLPKFYLNDAYQIADRLVGQERLCLKIGRARGTANSQVQTIAQFACHGSTNFLNPSLSGLHLGPTSSPYTLTVRELSELSLPNTQPAYLSACSTARHGDQGLLNEVLHVASAYQLAGFPQVIGMLWGVRDDVDMELGTSFYVCLRGRIKRVWWRVNGGMVARALHEAEEMNRKDAEDDFLGWASLVHFE